jgi:hypothetical protein
VLPGSLAGRPRMAGLIGGGRPFAREHVRIDVSNPDSLDSGSPRRSAVFWEKVIL